MVAVGCGVAPPERPSQLRVCSALEYNTLTGSVPSSLSALTKLTDLCVPPSCQRRLRVRPRRVGIGGLCSERAACRGVACRGHERGRCGRRAVAVVSEGTLGRGVTKEYSRGTLCMGYGARVPLGAHRCCGVRRSTARAAESASGVQLAQQQRADGECAELALRAHQS